MEVSFYVVWNPEHGNPRVRHDTQWQAVNEAERLASEHPGRKFYVLNAVSVSEHKTVVTTQLEPDLPF